MALAIFTQMSVPAVVMVVRAILKELPVCAYAPAQQKKEKGLSLLSLTSSPNAQCVRQP